MRYFDRHRRALIKKSLLRGTSHTETGDENQVAILSSAGAGIDYLEACGRSEQACPFVADLSSVTEYCGKSDNIDEYRSMSSDDDRWVMNIISFAPGVLLDGETTGTGLLLPLPEAWQGEGVSFEMVRKSTGELTSNVDLYLGYGVSAGLISIYDGLTPLLVDGEITSIITDGTKEYNYLVITDFMQDVGTDNPGSTGKTPSYADLNLFSDDYMLVVKKEVSEPSPAIPIDVKCASGADGTIVALRESKLPCEYQEVEYIQSDGNQYIFTGFIPNQDTRVVADFQMTDIYASFVFGARHASSYAFTFSISGTKNFVSARHTSGNRVIAAADINRHIVDYNRGTVALDSTLYTFDDYTFKGVRSITLFACADRNENNNYGYLPSKMKLYSCKIYDNDILVRSFIPCYRKLDYVAGLYDLVNGVFYENKGTGAFTFVKEVNTISSKAISDDEYYVDIANVQIPKRVEFENLFDVSRAELTNCELTDNGIISVGSELSIAYVDVPLPAGEYTLSFERNASFGVSVSNGRQVNDTIAYIGVDGKKATFNYTGNYDGYLRIGWTGDGNELSSISLVKAEDIFLELDFAGIGEYKDKLIVNKEQNRVIYSQPIKKLVLDGSESFILDSSSGYNVYCYSIQPGEMFIDSLGLCTHFLQKDVEQNEASVGFCPKGTQLLFRYDGVQDVDEFKAFLSEQYSKGAPVTAYCVREVPVSYDLTELDWAIELFSFNLPYEHNGGVALQGALEYGGVSVTYFAMDREDKAKLVVNFWDMNGKSIKESRTYNIRKNSKYTVYAPEIDGYVATIEQCGGYIVNDAAITIRYRRQK